MSQPRPRVQTVPEPAAHKSTAQNSAGENSQQSVRTEAAASAAPTRGRYSGFRGARFLLAAPDQSFLPEDDLPEIAFVGRSNAGKSSAINRLTDHRSLARVSRTPGRTQQLIAFDLGNPTFARLIDLPGYGFAKVPLSERKRWEQAIGGYLRNRTNLRGLVLVMDIRHAWTPLDQRLVGWLEDSDRPTAIHLLLTKADKLSRNQAQRALMETAKRVEADGIAASLQTFSAQSGAGREDLEHLLLDWVETPSAGT
ncbi:MAG: ribosome biogenesis GTP-binding protein YihA/YsxC [Thioalkalivibrionaceae bacterium]